MKPSKGLLSTNSHQVFTVKILPKEVKTYKHALQLKLNDAAKNTQVCNIVILYTEKHVWQVASECPVSWTLHLCGQPTIMDTFSEDPISFLIQPGHIPSSFSWSVHQSVSLQWTPHYCGHFLSGPQVSTFSVVLLYLKKKSRQIWQRNEEEHISIWAI